jgi:hypothetical protein
MDVRIYPFLIPKQGPCWTLLGPRTRHVRVQSQDFYPTEPSPGRAFKDTPRSRIETVQEYPAQGRRVSGRFFPSIRLSAADREPGNPAALLAGEVKQLDHASSVVDSFLITRIGMIL